MTGAQVKPTAVQRELIDKLRAAGRAVRIPGGFWTYAGCPYERPGVPSWFCTVHTIRALERLGLLARTHRLVDEWRDDRVLTPAADQIGDSK